MKSGSAGIWGVGALVLLAGCAFWGMGRIPGANLETAAAELAQMVDRAAGEEPIAVLAWRDAKGEQSSFTRAVDEYIITALLEANVPVVLADTEAAGKWGEDEPIPPDAWRDLSASRIVGGRLQEDADWAYLRLFVIDRARESLVRSHTWRLAQAELQKEVEEQNQLRDGGAAEEVVVDFHLLGLRDQGGFPEPITIEEGAELLAGDRLQIRFTPQVDCEVYAFLYTSEGTRVDVLGSRFVYGGREQYGPGEDAWIDLNGAGQVYTLYFVAASRLDENRGELFEEMGRLVEESQVDRYDGLDLLDQLMVTYLLKSVEEGVEIAVIRSDEEIELGKKMNFILKDGTPIESRAEKLRAASVLARAVSFEIQ